LYQTHYPEPVADIQQRREAIDLGFVREDLPKVMASMDMGTSRIQEIVQSLRKFSRVDEAAMKGVNIHDGIESTLLILQNRLKKGEKSPNSGVEVVKEYGDLPLVECYAGQLNQVFMNILCNAIDALESYQAVRSARASSPEEMEPYSSRITIRTELTPANTLLVCIEDNGPGMSDEVRKRLFDPFFTTKPVGKGTGLGLSISYHIVVEKHRGKLECLSIPGKGAQFRIEIPVRQPAPSPVGADICPNCIEPSQCRTPSATCQHLHAAKEQA
jgi:signal transduction histidine kinase